MLEFQGSAPRDESWERVGMVGAAQAGEAMRELLGHLSARESLLAWMVRWCGTADGESAWLAIWRACDDPKALANVLCALGVTRGVTMRAHRGGDRIEVRLELRDPPRVIECVADAGDVADAIRSRIPAPSLGSIVEAGRWSQRVR